MRGSLDPPAASLIPTGGPEWREFLRAYNEFCSDHHGIPLPNQTFGITLATARKACGDRLTAMAKHAGNMTPKDGC